MSGAGGNERAAGRARGTYRRQAVNLSAVQAQSVVDEDDDVVDEELRPLAHSHEHSHLVQAQPDVHLERPSGQQRASVPPVPARRRETRVLERARRLRVAHFRTRQSLQVHGEQTHRGDGAQDAHHRLVLVGARHGAVRAGERASGRGRCRVEDVVRRAMRGQREQRAGDEAVVGRGAGRHCALRCVRAGGGGAGAAGGLGPRSWARCGRTR